jgi:hypothetical protein
MKFSFVNENGEERVEQWDSYTDAYNQKYLYCKESESSAFYVNDGTMFYFTAFYGEKKSMLYYFYLTAYKVFLGEMDTIEVNDAMPLNIIKNRKISLWLNDFIAPFYNYIRVLYSVKLDSTDNQFDTTSLILKSKIQLSIFGKLSTDSTSTITLNRNSIEKFTFETKKTSIIATCINT